MEHGLSQRRACQIVALHRSTLHYERHPDHNADLGEKLRDIANRKTRYGYRRAWALVARAGLGASDTRIHRLWKRLGLQVPRRAKRKRRRGPPVPEPPDRAASPGHVWTYDFVFDACARGTKLKMLTIVDEFTPECLAIDVATSIPAARVIRVLGRLFAQEGAPKFLRSDNGPEFIAQALRAWLAQKNAGTLYIAPGCPWQNSFAESFNGKLRDECLRAELFHSVTEARVKIEAFRQEYNQERPHSSLGYQTPQEFKDSWLKSHSTEVGF